MPVQINYKNKLSKKLTDIILFVDENYNISGLKKHISKQEFSYVSDLIITKDPKKNIVSFDINSKKKIVLVSFKKTIKNSEAVNLGAKFYDIHKDYKNRTYNLISDTLFFKSNNLVGYFLHGLKLKSYKFDKYKTKKKYK